MLLGFLRVLWMDATEAATFLPGAEGVLRASGGSRTVRTNELRSMLTEVSRPVSAANEAKVLEFLSTRCKLLMTQYKPTIAADQELSLLVLAVVRRISRALLRHLRLVGQQVIHALPTNSINNDTDSIDSNDNTDDNNMFSPQSSSNTVTPSASHGMNNSVSIPVDSPRRLDDIRRSISGSSSPRGGSSSGKRTLWTLLGVHRPPRSDHPSTFSHGVSSRRICGFPRDIALSFLADWFVILLMIGAELGLQVVKPYERLVLQEDLDELKYPLLGNTISTAVLIICSVGIPIGMIILVFVFTRNRRDFHQGLMGKNASTHYGLAFSIIFGVAHALSLLPRVTPARNMLSEKTGLFLTILFTALLTDFVKLTVGRLRPDFFWRCFPDGVEHMLPNGHLNCTGIPSVIEEGRKSFPSGHSSWSFAGLGYLSLYFAGKLHTFNGHGHVWKFWVSILPLALALYIAMTRVSDYWHHWQDVSVGTIIGLFFAWASYRQFFPSIFDETPSLHNDRRYIALTEMDGYSTNIGAEMVSERDGAV
ncbi:lipid phosphate phosphatase 3 [Capsaspora owczarzaki ATCC 30864]|uniref:lipid phosphate phosphatase 3 n=1 Tax=Capsaspora owczarzaki (strain ATCC 30864) TaxID=595528 RepID=UPI0001FE6EAA|nr:lipid phosphate phosphatase 3 [Capsaspora owczarzaki ATCC 30864]|eukprot:XP_004364008.1 lipid phosphate phosphatase 3 [Capsaspora owczarzaki ATCC 30864]